MTYEEFKKHAAELRAKFQTGNPKIASLKLSPENYKIVAETLPPTKQGADQTPTITHNYMTIISNPFVPDNMILAVDSKGTIIGCIKIGDPG